MSSYKKNIIYICLIVILLCIYAFVGYCFFFRNEMSVEYDYYYREQKTKYWAGDNSLFLDPYNSNFVFTSEEDYTSYMVTDLNLQYIGKNTNLITSESTNQLLYLSANNNFYFYFRIDESLLSNPYQIHIIGEWGDDVTITLNTQLYNDSILIVKDPQPINCLQISAKNINIFGINFVKIGEIYE